MRITNKMITSKYTRSLNSLSIGLDKLNTQIASGRKFLKASENTSAAIKAFQVRKDLSKIEGYQLNIDHAKDSLTNAESTLMHMEELMKMAKDKIVFGKNATQSQSERKIIAAELRNIQDQLLQTLNSNSSDIHYFGGSNTDTKPFTLDADGNLLYNGFNLNDPSADANEEARLKADSLYVDIGLNVEFLSSGALNKNTVFSYSIAGINIVGNGKTTIDGTEVSNNLYNLLGEIASEFEADDYSADKMDTLLGHFSTNSDRILKSITEVGSKTAYLDFMTNRLESQTLNRKERQMSVEAADPAETIIKFESQRVAYNAALQMGTKVIQPSIFDFMR